MIMLARPARYASEPGRHPRATGIIPALSITLVTGIGRSRVRFASKIASAGQAATPPLVSVIGLHNTILS